MSDTYSVIVYPSAKLPDEYKSPVFDRWLKSFRQGNPFIKMAERKPYYIHYHAYIENLLRQPNSVVRLAVLTDAPDIILGFSACRGDVLDYIHVLHLNRKNGIAKSLVPENITTISHTTELAKIIWQEKYKHWKFNPFA